MSIHRTILWELNTDAKLISVREIWNGDLNIIMQFLRSFVHLLLRLVIGQRKMNETYQPIKREIEITMTYFAFLALADESTCSTRCG